MQSLHPRGHQIDRLIHQHGENLRALARRLCRSRADADDLVQDVLEKLIYSTIPANANELAWLSRVMHNTFIDMVRRRRTRREDLKERLSALQPVDVRDWWLDLDEIAVRTQLELLPAHQRRAFELFAFRGEDYATIATRLGVAKATVGTRILRARRKLRAILVEAYGPRACP